MSNSSATVNVVQDFIEVIRSRRSMKAVTHPGPSAEQLETALHAAVCAPDHAALRVWRFVLIEQADITAFVDHTIEVLEGTEHAMSPEKQDKARAWLAEVPLLVGLAYKVHHDNPKVPEIEQTLSMGAAVMNFQNALHAMGFASFWSSGLGTFSDEVPTMLGFDPLDYQFIGFLSVGTPVTVAASTRPNVRVNPGLIVSRWPASKR